MTDSPEEHFAIHDGLMDAVATGDMSVTYGDDGEARFSMTEQGKAKVEAMFGRKGDDA